MANVRVSWKNPNTRVGGRPLDAADISYVRVELSADGGQNFGEVGRVVGESFDQTELEPGTYVFRLTVLDKQSPAAVSAPVEKSFTLAEAAPSPVASVVVEVL